MLHDSLYKLFIRCRLDTMFNIYIWLPIEIFYVILDNL